MSSSQPLVSIVTPVYNAERFLPDTIKTVQDQTYENWEWLLVDDQSSDRSVEIIKEAAKSDERIKLIQLSKNSGAAVARNAGIDAANGRYLTFQDADDLWHPEKLAKQVAFMQENDVAFSFTGYEFASADGVPNGKKVYIPAKLTYKQALKNTTISTITVMFDMTKLAKRDVHMPNVKSEDTATWWNILRSGEVAYGLNELLSFYRRSANTKSSNKFTAIKQTWELYREQQKLGLFYSIYCFIWYVFNAIKRRA